MVQGQITAIRLVLRLPMRDGNVTRGVKHDILEFVLRLPMRDGN